MTVLMDSPLTPGYPAWAGIDLHKTPPNVTKNWLPRVGGDRPYDMVAEGAPFEVTPRGRG